MNLPTNSFPGTTAPQAQLARLKKKLTKMSDQLVVLTDRAQLLQDPDAQKLLARATSNVITALSLSEAVENITNQSALDLLTTPDNSVMVNVALTAFEDVPDICQLKPIARAITPVVIDEKLPFEGNKNKAGLQTDQPRRFTCCSPDPSKWFDTTCQNLKKPSSPTVVGAVGANTCEEPSYHALTLPVHINSSKERVDELLAISDLLTAAIQGQLGQARQSICHASGEDTCSLF